MLKLDSFALRSGAHAQDDHTSWLGADMRVFVRCHFAALFATSQIRTLVWISLSEIVCAEVKSCPSEQCGKKERPYVISDSCQRISPIVHVQEH